MRLKLLLFGKWMWSRKWWFVAAGTLGGVLLLAPMVYAVLSTRGARFAVVAAVPQHKVAIVFGAGVNPDGTPTPYLKRRLETAVHLFKAGKAQVLLLSGDNSTLHHNEPVAMQRYVVSLGVPASHTVLDYAGFNTYDTCYRAAAIFGVHDAILVSHAYHLPRALMTCDRLGVHGVGMAAENAGRLGRDFSANYILRELVGTDKALLQVTFKPHPTLLGPLQPIR